ncbi:YtxH domain-containing protein [Ferruginibacter albus]|uniref:YtxH domain-containing protein n=1 Tax=Ferruginibacter albus TaxID=2875540 RepID=UPI001CC7066D|nr:YtxH domain-containing protein [Ferruginibacter albus]UAY53148.1 YtxH domain-containing protein [Ferruginibacter albus]
MGTSRKVLTAVAVGAAVGAVLGILFAPDKGTETRKKIAERGKKFSDDVHNKWEKGKEYFNHAKNGKEETAI